MTGISQEVVMRPARTIIPLGIVATAVVFAVSLSAALVARQAAKEALAYTVVGTPTELGLAGYAKILCSAVFVSGRDADEAAKTSAYWMMPSAEQDKVAWTVDRGQKLVRASLGSITREAKLYGDQGCIIQN